MGLFNKLSTKDKPTNLNSYYNKKWNMALDYPAGWEVLWENESDGGWEIVVGFASKPSPSGRSMITIRVLQNAVINSSEGFGSVFAAGGSGAPLALPNSPEEYNEGCKRELINELPGLRFISEKTDTILGIPAGILLYSFQGQNGTIFEKQINIFGTSVTYRFMYESPKNQRKSTEEFFNSIVANFKPFVG